MNSDPQKRPALHVRYDLAATLAEAKTDFTPDAGIRRLLKQSEIAARFRKAPRNAPRSTS